MADSSPEPELSLAAEVLIEPRRNPQAPDLGVVALLGPLLFTADALLRPRAPLTESRRAAAALGKTGLLWGGGELFDGEVGAREALNISESLLAVKEERRRLAAGLLEVFSSRDIVCGSRGCEGVERSRWARVRTEQLL